MIKVGIMTMLFTAISMVIFGMDKETTKPYSHIETSVENPGTRIRLDKNVSITDSEAESLLNRLVLTNLEKNQHNSASYSSRESREMYQKLCAKFKDICNITTRD